MAATSNGTIYAWGDMSPTGDASVPAVMPRGDIPEGDKIVNMRGYNLGDTILMLTDRGQLFVSGTIDSRLMGRVFWLNFTDSPANTDGPRLLPTSNFFNESIVDFALSWKIIAAVTSKGELWVVTTQQWVFPGSESAPDPNFWFKLDPSGQGWKVLRVRVSDHIMALVEDPTGQQEWWSFGQNLCSSYESYVPKAATPNLVDFYLANWTKVDTSGALFSKRIKDVQLFHPTWACGTHFITEPFSLANTPSRIIRDPVVFSLQGSGLGRSEANANASLVFSGACSANLACSQISIIDSSSLSCRVSRDDVARFCSDGTVFASLRLGTVSSQTAAIATRTAAPMVVESLVSVPQNAKTIRVQLANVLPGEQVEIRFNVTDIKCVVVGSAASAVVCRLEGPSLTGPSLAAQVRVISSDQSNTSAWYPNSTFVAIARFAPPPSLTDRSGVTQFETVLPVSTPLIRMRASGLGADPSLISATVGESKCANITVDPLTSNSNVTQTVSCRLDPPLTTTGTVLGFVERSGGSSAVVPVAILLPNPSASSDDVYIPLRKYAANAQSIRLVGSYVGSDSSLVEVSLQSTSQRRTAVSCDVLSLDVVSSSTSIISCSPISDLSPGNLTAVVARSGVPGPPVMIGFIVNKSTITDTSSTVSLATNAEKLKIEGGDFASTSDDLSVTIFPQSSSEGISCNITRLSANSIDCLLSSSSATAWRGLTSVLQANVTSYGGLTSFVGIAKLVAPPSIASSNERININETSLRITGSGFSSSNWNVANTLVYVGYGSNLTHACGVTAAASSATLIVCQVAAGVLSQNASLFAKVFAHEGWSEAAPIGIVGADEPSSTTRAGLADGAIAGIVVAVLVVAASIILFLLFRARRRAARGKLDEEISKMADDMRGMFNVKMSDVEILDKLGEGSFGM
jgi:hypothetical protein